MDFLKYSVKTINNRKKKQKIVTETNGLTFWETRAVC